MSMKSQLGMLAVMSMMIGSEYADNSNDLRPEDIDTTPKEKPVPKGCQEYFFNKNRGYNSKEDRHTVFYCVAASLKSALKKFDKWESKRGVV